jgi:hypothetical protein
MPKSLMFRFSKKKNDLKILTAKDLKAKDLTDFWTYIQLHKAYGELHKWSLADLLSDIEAMPLVQEESRSKILAAVKENAIDGKILCDFKVCIYL